MVITREMLIRRLSEKSGYYMKDIRVVLQGLDEVILEYFGEATDDEDIMVQLVQGIKVGCSIQPERARKDPRTQENIVCKPTCKPKSKFSDEFRRIIQNQYESKKDG
jgi:nucleoid DNA-binding protein